MLFFLEVNYQLHTNFYANNNLKFHPVHETQRTNDVNIMSGNIFFVFLTYFKSSRTKSRTA